jgi:hypothetical protein
MVAPTSWVGIMPLQKDLRDYICVAMLFHPFYYVSTQQQGAILEVESSLDQALSLLAVSWLSKPLELYVINALVNYTV